MSAKIINSSDGLVTARISGKLTQPEFSALQQAVGNIIAQSGGVRLLVLVENFTGWEPGDWGDVSFQMEYDGQIEKMAILGDRKWKDLSLLFAAKGVRKFPIEYFNSAENTKALAWLGETVR